MQDVIEVSYTGDLLSHRRCRRAWAYEKHAGFRAYEQVQAMEGRLTHHAMEWLTRFFGEKGSHATQPELRHQLERHFRVLWARGIRTTFSSKKDTLDRVTNNLYPGGTVHPTVKVAVEGAQHTEYELRAVRKLVPTQNPQGKSRLMLTGILDLVIQLQDPVTYKRFWKWTSLSALDGQLENHVVRAQPNDVEIWDYKGSRATTPYLRDYLIQLLTYAALYQERTGNLPKRCVLFFVNEPNPERQLVAVEVDDAIIQAAVAWTLGQVAHLQQTIAAFEKNPLSVKGGEFEPQGDSPISPELRKQCTTCGRRFDCEPYRDYLQEHGQTADLLDIDRESVLKN